jgi:hypothetical protein
MCQQKSLSHQSKIFLTSRHAGSYQFPQIVAFRTIDHGSLGHDCYFTSQCQMMKLGWRNHKKVCKNCTPFIVGNKIHPSLINLYRDLFYSELLFVKPLRDLLLILVSCIFRTTTLVLSSFSQLKMTLIYEHSGLMMMNVRLWLDM